MSLTDLLTATGIIITGIGLAYAGMQLRRARKIARSEFLLHLFELLQKYNEVHNHLTDKGWGDGRVGPESHEEWSKVERYMGLFESVQILIEDGIVDRETIDRLYSHRVAAIVKNPVIYKRNLVERKDRWQDFIKLVCNLEKCKVYCELIAEEKMLTNPQHNNSLNPTPR